MTPKKSKRRKTNKRTAKNGTKKVIKTLSLDGKIFHDVKNMNPLSPRSWFVIQDRAILKCTKSFSFPLDSACQQKSMSPL
jgi:hypothetical protein